MAIRNVMSNINVLEASKIRIKNVFDTGARVYLSFSAGKDSLVLSSLIYDLIMDGEIDAKQLLVTFIDEEAIYPSMVKQAILWRKKFLLAGAEFIWFCLPFKQVSVIDGLSADESWITWEPSKRDCWVRQPPSFAIMESPYIKYAGEMNYQTFCDKVFNDGIRMIGLRTAESFTRIKAIAKTKTDDVNGKFYPIYDWTDGDVWKYIKDKNLEFPEIYMQLYELGQRRSLLRLSTFFGDGSSAGLKWLAEADAELWEKINKRQPNAYLALLYWDSEMFRRQSKERTELEKNAGIEDEKDYRYMLEDLLFKNTDRYAIAKDTYKTLDRWRSLYKRTYDIATEKHYKRMYEAILYGDPKGRMFRIMFNDIYQDYTSRTKGGK